MPWDIEAESAYLSSRGIPRRWQMTTTPPGDAPAGRVAQTQMDFFRVPARIFRATSWGQWLRDADSHTESGRFEPAWGVLRLDHWDAMEASLTGARHPRALDAWATAFHEGIHSLGEDRELLLKERVVDSQDQPALTRFIEGLTALASSVFLPDYLQGMGVGFLADELQAESQLPHSMRSYLAYGAETAYVEVMLTSIANDLGREPRDLIAELVRGGSSPTVAFRHLVAQWLGPTLGTRDAVDIARRQLLDPLNDLEPTKFWIKDPVRRRLRAVEGERMATVAVDQARLARTPATILGDGGAPGLTMG